MKTVLSTLSNSKRTFKLETELDVPDLVVGDHIAYQNVKYEIADKTFDFNTFTMIYSVIETEV